MQYAPLLFFILFIVASCDNRDETPSSPKKEIKGNIKAYHYPFETLDSLVIYKYKTKDGYNGQITYGQLFIILNKNEDELLELLGFDQDYKPVMHSKLAFGTESLTELERRFTLGDTELAQFNFLTTAELYWEQNSQQTEKEKSTVTFMSQNQSIELRQQRNYTFDGFKDKKFSFTNEKHCAKINQQTSLQYFDNLGNLIFETETNGYVLDLKGIGPAYGIETGPIFTSEYELIDIITGQRAQELKNRMIN
ncbi:MAG: hypothetical protein ACFHU9_04520 [Fluviicola sp.]